MLRRVLTHFQALLLENVYRISDNYPVLPKKTFTGLESLIKISNKKTKALSVLIEKEQMIEAVASWGTLTEIKEKNFNSNITCYLLKEPLRISNPK